MSVAWYVVFERKIPGFDLFISGKALAHASDKLNAIAKANLVRSLTDFFSAPPQQLQTFAGEHGVEIVDASSETWFLAEEAIRTVKRLIEVGENGQLESDVVIELKELQSILEVARDNEVRWHLAVDF
jgi:hypothetical protein